jgi:hypothetical protein
MLRSNDDTTIQKIRLAIYLFRAIVRYIFQEDAICLECVDASMTAVDAAAITTNAGPAARVGIGAVAEAAGPAAVDAAAWAAATSCASAA